MTRKNIVFIARSLDGFIAGKNGELDWLDAIPNPDQDDMGFYQLMSEVDALVMGRVTFETVLAFGVEWPYTKHVFVLTNSLKVIPEHLNGKVSLLGGSPAEVLAQIHEKGYFNLYIDGGTTIQNFLSADLIDELRISTIPVLLGGGFPLFGDLIKPMEFEHIDTKVFLGEIVQSHYRRKRRE